MGQLTAEGVLEDVDAALEVLATSAVEREGIGVVGFCMGGTVALVTAVRREVRSGGELLRRRGRRPRVPAAFRRNERATTVGSSASALDAGAASAERILAAAAEAPSTGLVSAGDLPGSAVGLSARGLRTDRPGPAVSEGPAVWRIDLADHLVAADLDLLDATERARVDRYVNPVHGARFGTARAAGKRLVGRALGVDPGRVAFGRRPCPRCTSAEHGPPVVVGAEDAVHISASRRGPLAVLAISDDPVGVDVEPRGSGVDVDGVARMSLTPHELAIAMAAGSDAEREAVLLRCWTRKEAVLKAAGIGIAVGLQRLEVHADHGGPVVVAGPADLPAVRWQVTDLDIDGGATFAAVAQPADRSGPVRFGRWCGPAAP